MLDSTSKYVYEVYRCKSVSVAAEKLYLSQPALSASIKRAETELGAKIFNRKTLPFTLTTEGKIYISAIEKIIQIEQDTYARIQDIQEYKGGIINIATSTNLSYYIIPKICKQYSFAFPNVEINIIHSKTSELSDLLTNSTADLVFIPTEGNAPGFTVIPLIKENLIIAVSKKFSQTKHLHKYGLSYYDILNQNIPEEKKITDMSVFHDIDFIYSSHDSNIYKKRKLIFGENDSSSYINTTSQNQRLDYNLMRSGFGALLTTDADIVTTSPDDSCIYFALKNPIAKQNFCIAHAKVPDSPTYKIVNEFVKIAKDFFDCENPLKKIL